MIQRGSLQPIKGRALATVAGMKCPHCGPDHSRVKDSRATADSIRRRRLCSNCGARWTTFEVYGDEADRLETLIQFDADLQEIGAANQLLLRSLVKQMLANVRSGV